MVTIVLQLTEVRDTGSTRKSRKGGVRDPDPQESSGFPVFPYPQPPVRFFV